MKGSELRPGDVVRHTGVNVTVVLPPTNDEPGAALRIRFADGTELATTTAAIGRIVRRAE